ncbi:MAG TPA: hypothetical protein VH370_05835 [Humisphaera sp.]|jgi:hypothetical protein|nr:hypothetical protein [Humisphaera sp.]
MLKATAWRLAGMLHCKSAQVIDADEKALRDLLSRVFAGGGYGSGRGSAARLVAKVIRLRTV